MGSNWNAERVAAWEPSARPDRAAAGVTACRTRRRVVTAGVCIATLGLLVGVQWSGVTVLGELESPESAALAHALEAHLVRDTERRGDAATDTGTVGREERSRSDVHERASPLVEASQQSGAGRVWAREPKRELEFGRTALAGNMRGFMLMLDPRIDAASNRREALNEALVFLLVCSAVFFGMRAFDAFGGCSLFAARHSPSSPHNSDPANRWWSKQIDHGFFFAPLPPSPPLFFVMGLCGGVPIAVALATVAIPIVLPLAHPTAVRLFPATARAAGAAAVLLLVGPGALMQGTPPHRRHMFSVLLAVPTLVLIPALSHVAPNALGSGALLGVGAALGAASALSTATLLGVAAALDTLRPAPTTPRGRARTAAGVWGSISAARWAAPLLAGYGTAPVLLALAWIMVQTAAEAPGTDAEAAPAAQDGARQLLLLAALFVKFGGYLTWRVLRSRCGGVSFNRSLPRDAEGRAAEECDDEDWADTASGDGSKAAAQRRSGAAAEGSAWWLGTPEAGWGLGLVVSCVGSAILFPGLMDSAPPSGQRLRPQWLAAILMLLHAMAVVAGLLVSGALSAESRVLRQWEAAAGASIVWLRLAVVRGLFLPLGVMVAMAVGWRDNALLLCYALTAGLTHGLLTQGLVVRGLVDGMASAQRISGGWVGDEGYDEDDEDEDHEQGGTAGGVRFGRHSRLLADGMLVGGRMELAAAVGAAGGGLVAAAVWG